VRHDVLKMVNFNIIGCSLLLLLIVYLSSPVLAGKCSGRWAIHACGGGNGKRSGGEYLDDSMNDVVVGERNFEDDEDSKARGLLDSLVRLSESHDEDQSSFDEQLRTDKKDSGLWNDDRNLEDNSAHNRREQSELNQNSSEEPEREKMAAALRLMRLLHAR